MVVKAGPILVYSNLVFHLDAANIKSYPGSGNTINSIDSNKISTTFQNSATYSSSSKGAVNFTKSSLSYVNFGSINATFSQFSIMCWFNPSTITNYSNVLDCNYGNYPATGNIGPRLELYPGNCAWVISSNTTNNEQFDFYVLSSSISDTNKWYFAALVKKANGTMDAYLNDQKIISSASNTKGSVTTFGAFSLGRGWHLGGQDRYWNGLIGPVLIYDTELSSDQIMQNFNAFRGRYAV